MQRVLRAKAWFKARLKAAPMQGAMTRLKHIKARLKAGVMEGTMEGAKARAKAAARAGHRSRSSLFNCHSLNSQNPMSAGVPQSLIQVLYSSPPLAHSVAYLWLPTEGD